MATSGGVIIALFPGAFLIGIGVWIIVFLTTRYVSVASLAGTVAVPSVVITMYVLHRADWLGVAVSLVMASLIFWLHRTNIARLRAGTEARFERKKP
jgi:glycerol-3-phosphate acyltransferase PlsY